MSVRSASQSLIWFLPLHRCWRGSQLYQLHLELTDEFCCSEENVSSTIVETRLQDTSSVISTCWYSYPCVTPSHIVPKLASVTNSIWQKWWYIISSFGVLSVSLCLPISLQPVAHSLWRSKLTCHEDTQTIYGDTHVLKNWSLQKTMWASLEVGPFCST